MVLALLLVPLGWSVAQAAEREAPPLSPEKIQRGIEKSRDWLLREQLGNGAWECTIRTEETRIGTTSLVMLALANAGLEANHVAMQRGLEWLRRQKPDDTYSVSLQTMILALLTPDADRAILQRNVEWLESAQVSHCLLYTSPSPRDRTRSRMPSSA